MHERLRDRASAATSRRRALLRPPLTGARARSAGPTPGGSRSGPAPTWSRSGSTRVRTAGCRPARSPRRSSSRPRAADVDDRGRGRRRRSSAVRPRIVSSDVAARSLTPAAIDARRGGRMSAACVDRHRRARHQRPERSAIAAPTPPLVVDDGADRLGRPGRAAPRPPTAGSTPAAARSSPGFVDCHTHLVFAGDRAAEFAARMAGEPYTGGGIAHDRRRHPRRRPTTTCARCWPRRIAECARRAPPPSRSRAATASPSPTRSASLRLAAEFTAETTFLGAHVVPAGVRDRPDDYVALVSGPMLDACAPHARWVDVFCEPASPPPSTPTRPARS